MATQKPGEWANSLLTRFEEQVRIRWRGGEQSDGAGRIDNLGLLLGFICYVLYDPQNVCRAHDMCDEWE